MRRTAQPRTVARQPLIKKAAAPVQRKNGIKTRGAYPSNKEYTLDGEFQISDTFYGKMQKLNVGTIIATATGSNITNVILVADESGIVSNSVDSTTPVQNCAVLFDSDANETVGIKTNPITFTGALADGTIFATKRTSTVADTDVETIRGLFVNVKGYGTHSPGDYRFAFYTYNATNNTYTLESTIDDGNDETTGLTPADPQYYFTFFSNEVIRIDSYIPEGQTEAVSVTIKQEFDDTANPKTATIKAYNGSEEWTEPIKYPFRAADSNTVEIKLSPLAPESGYTYVYSNDLIFDQAANAEADPVIPALYVSEPITTTADVEIKEDTWFNTAIQHTKSEDSVLIRYNNAAYFTGATAANGGNETACEEWIIDTEVDYEGKNIAHGNAQAMESTSATNLTFMENTVRVLSGKEGKNGVLICGGLDVSGCTIVEVQGGDNTDSENIILPGTIKCATFTIGKE